MQASYSLCFRLASECFGKLNDRRGNCWNYPKGSHDGSYTWLICFLQSCTELVNELSRSKKPLFATLCLYWKKIIVYTKLSLADLWKKILIKVGAGVDFKREPPLLNLKNTITITVKRQERPILMITDKMDTYLFILSSVSFCYFFYSLPDVYARTEEIEVLRLRTFICPCKCRLIKTSNFALSFA